MVNTDLTIMNRFITAVTSWKTDSMMRLSPHLYSLSKAGTGVTKAYVYVTWHAKMAMGPLNEHFLLGDSSGSSTYQLRH
jgi:hypothetical protein